MAEADLLNVPVIRNPRHQLFADAYLEHGNAARAAREAEYSVKTAAAQGAGLLRLQDVAAYVAFMREQSTEIAGVSKTRILMELKNIALSNVADFTRLNEDGELEVDFGAATRDQLAAVSAVKVRTRTILDNRGKVIGTEKQSEFRLWDKLRAAELLGKDLGMFKEPEQRVVIDVADRLLRARARVVQTALGVGAAEGSVVEG